MIKRWISFLFICFFGVLPTVLGAEEQDSSIFTVYPLHTSDSSDDVLAADSNSSSLGLQPFCSYTISFTSGYTVPNMKSTRYIGKPTFGIDAAVLWQTDGTREWHHKWKYPSFGIRANYTYCFEGIAGDRIGALGFVQSPIFRSKSGVHMIETEQGEMFQHLSTTHTLSWVIGGGLAVYTNPYSRTPNDLNRFIGSYLNCMLELGVVYDWQLHDRSALSVSAKIVHNSNGYLKKPNYGLNFLQAELGYRLPQKKYKDIYVRNGENHRDTTDLWTEFYASYAPGIVQPRYTGSAHNYYYCHTAQIGYIMHPHANAICAFGGNVDITYNYSLDELRAFHRDSYKLPFLVGVCGSVEPYWGPLSIRLSMGGYMYKSPLSSVVSLPFYERLGAFYHFGKRESQFVGVSMQLYAAHINFIEWHYGIRLYDSRRYE